MTTARRRQIAAWRLKGANVRAARGIGKGVRTPSGKVPRSTYNGVVAQRERKVLQGKALRFFPRANRQSTKFEAYDNQKKLTDWMVYDNFKLVSRVHRRRMHKRLGF